MAGQAGVLDKVASPDGTPIAYWRSGRGPALVLVHGASADHSRWELVLPLLEPHVTVYAVDRRGRGGSGDGLDYSLDAEAADVAAVVDRIAESTGGPVDLLGHSYGAQCALEAALLTDGLRRLLLYEPGSEVPQEFVDELAGLLEQGRREDIVTTLLRFVGMPEDALQRSMSLPSWPGRVAAAHTVVREIRAVNSYRFDPVRFASLRVPTLLLAGSESPAEEVAPNAALAAALPDARTVTMSGHGHVAMTTGPDLFAAAVLDFLGADKSRGCSG